MTAKKAAGIGLGFIAVLIVSLPGATFPGWEALPWIAFGILTPACFAVANTFSARLRPKVNDSLRDSVGMMGVSATALAVVALVAGQSYAFTPWNGGAGDLSLIVHGTLAALAFFLFFVVLERGGPIMVASASYLILLFSGLWGWLFFDEVPSAAFFIAGLFVVVGLTLVLDLLPPQRKSAS